MDLVSRLRAEIPYQGKSRAAFLCHEAADRIEADARRIAELAEAYLADAKRWKFDGPGVRFARAALGGKTDG